jgi:hypothetical protein
LDLPQWQAGWTDRIRSLQSLFAGLPDAPEDRLAVLQRLHAAIEHELATQFEPVLNELAKSLPIETLDDKQKAAGTVNQWLRELKLSLSLPSEPDVPATLSADRGPGAAESGRFRFVARQAHGRRREGWSHNMPHLQVVPAPIRAENFSMRYRSGDRHREGTLER